MSKITIDELALQLLANPTGEPMKENDREFLGAMLQGAGYTSIKLYTSNHLVVPVEIEREAEIDRSWRERLFSWPWRPWIRTKTFVYKETAHRPDPNLYFVNGTVYCHPTLAAEVIRRTGVSYHGPALAWTPYVDDRESPHRTAWDNHSSSSP